MTARSKRVLLITLRADHGGGPRHVDLLLQGLTESHEVWLACPKDEPYYSKWLASGANGIYVLPHRKFTLMALLGLVRFILRERITLVHSHGKGAGVYSRLAKLLLPFVRVIHTLHGVHIGNYSGAKKGLYILFERWASLLTSGIINVSHGEQALCLELKLFKKEKSRVIYNGSPPAPAISRHRCAGEKSRIVVATISRFDFQKNMRLAFEIASLMRDEKEYLFLWLGDGDDAAGLKELSLEAGLENIVFAGFQDDVGSYLAQSDIYLSTSRWEGLPIAVIEALSFGIPVIASDVVGNTEVVEHGYNGFLYDVNQPEAAVRHLLSLKAEHLRSSLSLNAKAYYGANFTLEQMLHSVRDIYDNC